MAQIQVRPQDLMSKASQIRDHAKKIQAAIDSVDGDIKALNTSQFEGHRATELRSRYQKYHDYLNAFRPMIERFANELDLAAAKFKAADQYCATARERIEALRGSAEAPRQRTEI